MGVEWGFEGRDGVGVRMVGGSGVGWLVGSLVGQGAMRGAGGWFGVRVGMDLEAGDGCGGEGGEWWGLGPVG